MKFNLILEVLTENSVNSFINNRQSKSTKRINKILMFVICPVQYMNTLNMKKKKKKKKNHLDVVFSVSSSFPIKLLFPSYVLAGLWPFIRIFVLFLFAISFVRFGFPLSIIPCCALSFSLIVFYLLWTKKKKIFFFSVISFRFSINKS